MHDDTVEEQGHHKARDCDGLGESWYSIVCYLEELDARENPFGYDFLLPKWQRVTSESRDYTAEAAGY